MAIESQSPLLEKTTGTSFIKACFNGTNAFLGIGILTVPYALSSGGWLSLLLFFLVSIITFYTAILLKRSMDIDPSIRNYLDIAERAFGKTGRFSALIIMNCELYLVCIGLLILEGDNLYNMFPNFKIQMASYVIQGTELFVIIAGLVILPTMLMTDLGILSYVSASGVIFCLTILGLVISVGFFDGVGFDNKGSVLDLTRFPTSLSLYIVCFAGHPITPSVYTSMRHPKKFNKVLLFTFILTTLTYLSMAVVGYLIYGDNVESQITINLPTNSIFGRGAIYAALLIPITRYALTMTPVAEAIESDLLESLKKGRVHKRVIRVALLASTVIFAAFFPYFESLMSIIGSVFVVLGSFVLPCLCYLKISQLYRSWSFELASIVGIVVFGAIVGGLGTYSSILSLNKI